MRSLEESLKKHRSIAKKPIDKIKWNSKNSNSPKRRKGNIMEQTKKAQIEKYQDDRVKPNYISITLNVNSIHAPFKRTVIVRLDKKARFICTLFARDRL